MAKARSLFLCRMKLLYSLFLIIPVVIVSHSELAHIMSEIGTKKYLLLLVPRLGFANRFRSIADWHTVAGKSNRTLLVSWEVGQECNAKVRDFFSADIPNVLFLDQPIPSTSEGVKLAASVAQSWNVTHLLWEENDDMWAEGYSSFILSKSVVISDFQILITNYNGIFSMEGSSCATYLDSLSQFFSNLVPNENALNFASSAYEQHFANNVMVGVHYRAHDRAQDWAVVPPLLGDPTDKIFGEGATIDDFIRIMKQIEAVVAYTDADGNLRTKVRFFIASNSEVAKNKIAESFPTAVSLYGDHRRASEAGMQLAFYEWLMLSRSAFILHTYGSTFAETAARARRIPIVGIWEGMLLHHSSAALPFCGSLDFARSYGTRKKKSKYQLGVNTDNSEVIIMLNILFVSFLKLFSPPFFFKFDYLLKK